MVDLGIYTSNAGDTLTMTHCWQNTEYMSNIDCVLFIHKYLWHASISFAVNNLSYEPGALHAGSEKWWHTDATDGQSYMLTWVPHIYG